MSDSVKGVLKKVQEEIIDFSFVALKNGASNVGKQLVNVTKDENQPFRLQIKTFIHALKTGIIGIGEELINIGLERIKENSQQK